MRRVPFVLALVLAGCGGSPDAAPRKPVTQAEYVRQANAICAGNLEKVRRLATVALDRAQDRGSSKDAAAAAVIRTTLPVLRRSFQRVRRLEAPSADRARLEDFWGRADDSLPLLARAGRAYRDGDTPALRALRRRLVAVAADTRPFAREYGLAACMPD